MGGFSFNKLQACREACSFALWMNDLAHAFSLFCVLVFLSASLRISQLYWPSGQLCFGGSAHSTHPSRYKAFLVLDNPCACFLLIHPLLQTTAPTELILPWLFCLLPKSLLFFFSKHNYFLSNLLFLSPWNSLARVTRMRLYLICPAYSRQDFNTAELATSYTPQNWRFLLEPVTFWGPWPAHGMWDHCVTEHRCGTGIGLGQEDTNCPALQY